MHVFKNRPKQDFSSSILEYQCRMLEVTIFCTVIFHGVNAIFAGIAYIWHNRQKLYLFSYGRRTLNPYHPMVSYGRRTLNPYHPIENCEIEMEYDVYISYGGDFNVTPGPNVIKRFSRSAQLSMKFHLLINVKIIKISGKFRFKTKKLAIYPANKYL